MCLYLLTESISYPSWWVLGPKSPARVCAHNGGRGAGGGIYIGMAWVSAVKAPESGFSSAVRPMNAASPTAAGVSVVFTSLMLTLLKVHKAFVRPVKEFCLFGPRLGFFGPHYLAEHIS